MISISTPTFDMEGSLVIRDYDPSTDVMSRSRRVSRTATLDGGCMIEDNGLSHSDRMFTIISNSMTRNDFDRLGMLIESYSTLYISTDEGVFKGTLENISYAGGRFTASILVKEKLT